MATATEGQQHPLSIYFWIWGLLFVLSAGSYASDFLPHGLFRSGVIVALMLAKAGFIIAIFMHMKWERLALIWAILGPPVVLLVLIGLKLVSAEQAYTFIDWRLLILVAGMTGFGTAMERSGASEYLAGAIVTLTQPLGVYGALAGFSVLTMALTQPMSNAAAVLVVLPVAMSTATQLGCDPRTFAILVTLSASLSFVTPFEPACILVYGPGGYRFRDFLLAGTPLVVIVWLAFSLFAPWYYGI